MTGEHQLILETHSVEETQNLGRAIGSFMAHYKGGLCFALVGDLGSGKTHLSQGIGQGFGVTEEMTSPTFAIMNTYQVGRRSLYHFDLYRLEDTTELDTIGFYEYTEEQPSIVEWADKFPDELPEETVWVHFEKVDDSTRKITLSTDELTQEELREIGGAYVVGH